MNYSKPINQMTQGDWERLESLVKESLKNDKSGHDYPHSARVFRNALSICKKYSGIDYDVLVASCWLHDIAFKDGLVKNHHLISAKQAPSFLKKVNFPYVKIKKVQIVIEDHVGQTIKPVRKNSQLSIESKILRDADNLDALGSIGLARQIAFCSANNIPYFISKEDCGFNKSVYCGVKELMTWPYKMLTPEAKKIAMKRLPVMAAFLKQLEKEYSS